MPCAQPPGDAGSCPGGEKCHCFSPPLGLRRLSLQQLSGTLLLLLAAAFPCSRMLYVNCRKDRRGGSSVSTCPGSAARSGCARVCLTLPERPTWSLPKSAAGTRRRCVRRCLGLRITPCRRVKRRARRGFGDTVGLCSSPCLSLRPSPHQWGCGGVSCGKPAAAQGNTTTGGGLQWPSHSPREGLVSDVGSRVMLGPDDVEGLFQP